MTLTGQAKTDYQREYMRRYRANKGKEAYPGSKAVLQNARGLPVVDEVKSVRPVRPIDSVRPKPQSHSPMMVGYVPPKE